MGNSKVIFGNETLIDLTGDTVTPDTLLAGTTAHNRSGNQIVGTATVPDTLDDLTDVELTSPAEGDLLQRDGSGEWVNSAVIPQKVAGLQKTGCVNRYNNTLISQVIDNVTVTVSADKTVTINSSGPITNAIDIVLGSGTYFETGDYKLVGCPAGGSSTTYRIRLTTSNITPSGVNDVGDGVTFTVTTASVLTPKIELKAGNTFTNLVFKPMITDDLSATYADYQPYSMTNRELTEAVTGLDGYYVTKEVDGNGARLGVQSLGNGTKTVGTALTECASSLLSLAQSLPSDECIKPSSIYAFINSTLSFGAKFDNEKLVNSANSVNVGYSDISMSTTSKVIITTGRMRNTSSDAIQTEITSNGNTFNDIHNTVLTSSSNYVRVFYNIYKKI